MYTALGIPLRSSPVELWLWTWFRKEHRPIVSKNGSQTTHVSRPVLRRLTQDSCGPRTTRLLLLLGAADSMCTERLPENRFQDGGLPTSFTGRAVTSGLGDDGRGGRASEGTHLVVFVSLGKYGGVEAFIPLPNGVGLALAPAVVAPAAGVAIQGSIDMTKAKSTRVNTSAVNVYWMGWGHPNTLFAEPGIQAVLFRTSVNIWHEPTVQLFCDKNGQGKYKALALREASFQHAHCGLIAARVL